VQDMQGEIRNIHGLSILLITEWMPIGFYVILNSIALWTSTLNHFIFIPQTVCQKMKKTSKFCCCFLRNLKLGNYFRSNKDWGKNWFSPKKSVQYDMKQTMKQ